MGSPIFEKYWRRIAADFGLPCNTSADKEQTWAQLSCLPTFVKKASLPKLGRWFSWNSVAHEQLPEYSALQMLLEYHFGFDFESAGADDEEGRGENIAAVSADDPRQELAALKSVVGGLKLAATLMMSDDALLQNAKILFTVTNGLWNWYVSQVKRVKCPRHAFKYDLHMAQSWAADSRSTVTALLDEGALKSMGLLPEPGDVPDPSVAGQLDSVASRAHQLVWHVVANRCWSLAKHSCPPHSCALLGASSESDSAAAAERACSEWASLLRLEQMALTVGAAKELRDDVHWANSPAIRLLFCFFERDCWSTGSVCGQRWLRGLLMRLPDNKIVEDLHCSIRNASRSNPNSKLTGLHMQQLIMNSNALESRKVRHSTEVCQRTFRAQLGSTRFRRMGWRSSAASHKLPASWTAVMGRRTWPSPTPESAHRATAAWAWLRTYMDRPAAADPLPISRGWLATLVRPFTVVVGPGGQLVASLGNARWAALGWPLRRLTVPECSGGAEAEHLLQWDGGASAQWFHVTDLKDWHVLPVQAISPLTARLAYPSLAQDQPPSVLLRVTGAPVTLLSHFFCEKTCLSHAELLRLAQYLELGNFSSNTDRCVLIQAIAEHAADGSPEERAAFAQAALQRDAGRQTDDKDALAEDPLCEQAYEELGPDDQLEFQDLKECFKKQKVRNRVAAWRAAQEKALERDAVAKAKAKARALKGKAKAKAKAKAKGKRRSVAGQFARAAKAARLAAGAAQPALQPPPLSVAAAAAMELEPLQPPPLAQGESAAAGRAAEPPADAARSAQEGAATTKDTAAAEGDPAAPASAAAEATAASLPVAAAIGDSMAVGEPEVPLSVPVAAAAAAGGATAAPQVGLEGLQLAIAASTAEGGAAAPASSSGRAAAADAAKAAQPQARGGRGPNLDANLTWTCVACDQCGQQAVGQYKLDPCPGGRQPVWMMRVWDKSGWPSQGPLHRVRRTSVVGESDSFAKKWIQENRQCCSTAAVPGQLDSTRPQQQA